MSFNDRLQDKVRQRIDERRQEQDDEAKAIEALLASEEAARHVIAKTIHDWGIREMIRAVCNAKRQLYGEPIDQKLPSITESENSIQIECNAGKRKTPHGTIYLFTCELQFHYSSVAGIAVATPYLSVLSGQISESRPLSEWTKDHLEDILLSMI